MAKGRKTGGRVKGTPNKLTASAREAFALAFDTLGGPQALVSWAKDNPTEFFKLYARLIPVDVQHGGSVGTFVVTVPPKHVNSTAWMTEYVASQDAKPVS